MSVLLEQSMLEAFPSTAASLPRRQPVFSLFYFSLCVSSVDSDSTVAGLQSIFHEREMTETVLETQGHGYLSTFVGKNGR